MPGGELTWAGMSRDTENQMPMDWSQPVTTAETGLGLHQQIALAALAFLALVSHRPDAVLNAQFFAEDGLAWYRDAYEFGGLNVLFSPQAGYQHLLQRLAGALAVLLPLRLAPLLFNLIAISCQVLVVNLLASRRLAFLIPDLRVRLVMGLVYVGLPDSWEVLGLLSTAHWHLAVVACIVILGEPARDGWSRAADCGLLLLAVLSGPFAILLLPMAALTWLWRRERWSVVLLSLVTCGALVQGVIALLTAATGRGAVPLGASPRLFVDIVGIQVFLAGLIGEELFFYNLPSAINRPMLVWAAFFGGAAVFAYTLWRSPWPVRLFVGFALAVLAAALTTPLVAEDSAQWPQLLIQGVGGRYWLLPRVAFLVALYWMGTAATPRLARVPAKLALMLLLPMGIAVDWVHRPFADLGWSERVGVFYAAEPGTTIEFPVHPRGWTLTLTKK